MQVDIGPSSNPPAGPILLLLFGALEFDGRAQRMAEIVARLGALTLVDRDIPGPVTGNSPTDDADRVRVAVRPGRVRQHLHYWLEAGRTAKRVRPAVVVAENYLTAPLGWLIARLFGAALIYDAYELIIPEQGVRQSLRNRFWYACERFVVARAVLVVAANQERAARMAAHYQLPSVPLHMQNIPTRRSPLGGDEQSLRNHPSVVRNRKEDRIVVYQGYMCLDRGIGRFLEALAHLPEHFKLLLIGDGPDERSLGLLARQLNIETRVTQLGRIPNALLPDLTEACDIGIVTYSFSGLNNTYCAPNKLFEYAQAGLPVIATSQPTLRAVIDKYGIGTCIGPDHSAVEIAEAILKLAKRDRTSYRSALRTFLNENCGSKEVARVRAEMLRVLTAKCLQ